MNNNNVGGYVLSGVSWLGVGLSMQEGLQMVGAWLAVASASLSLLYTIIKFIIFISKKIKTALADKKLTAEEKKEISDTIKEGVENIKDNLEDVNDAINNIKKGG